MKGLNQLSHMGFGKKLKKCNQSEICLFCNKKTSAFINAPDNDSYESKSYNVFFCLYCDIGFIPFVTLPENLTENYETIGYYSEFDENSNNLQNSSSVLLLLEKIFNKKRLNVLIKYKKNGNLLDVGCGSGKFLTTATSNFNNVYGVEVSKQGRKFLMKKNIISEKSIFCNKFKDNYFDAITYWHSFEHMKNPSEILKKTKDLLKKDGILLISVPNYNSIGRYIFNKFWFHLDVPRHIFHYTEKSLRNLIENSNFEVVDIKRNFLEYDISGIIQSLLNYFGFGKNVLKKSMKYGRCEKNLIKVYLFLPIIFIPFLIIWLFELLLKKNETICFICKYK